MFNLRNPILLTICNRLLLQLIGFGVSLYVIKLMGAEVRGRYFLCLSYIQLLVQALNFGAQSANTYFVSKDSESLKYILSNNLIVVLTASIISFFVLMLIDSFYTDLTSVEAFLIWISVPLSLYNLFASGILAGLKKFNLINKLELATKLMGVFFLTVLVLKNVVNHHIYLIAAFLTSLAWFLLSSNESWFRIRYKVTFNLDYFKKCLRYGFKAYISTFLFFLVLKVDVWMIQYYLGSASLGTYSVAITIVDAILIIPSVFGQILFSSWSSIVSIRERINSYRKYLVLNFVCLSFVSLLMYFFAPQLLKLFFKVSYEGLENYTLILSFASIFIGSNMLSMNYLASVGMPLYVIIIPCIGLFMNVSLNFLTIPKHGLYGACFSSLISYFFIFILGLYSVWITSKSDTYSETE